MQNFKQIVIVSEVTNPYLYIRVCEFFRLELYAMYRKIYALHLISSKLDKYKNFNFNTAENALPAIIDLCQSCN